MMDMQVTQSYKFAGAPRSDQAAVWGEVSRKLNAMGSHSPSSELQAAYRDHDPKLAEAIKQLRAPEGFHGAVFSIAGRISGADLFDKPETLRKLWPKLVRSCVIDSFEASKENSASTAMQDVTAWLERGTCSKPTRFPSPGIGEDIRLEGEDIFGAGLLVEDQPVHVELFCPARGKPSRPGPRPDSSQQPEADREHHAASADVPAVHGAGRGGNWLNRIFRKKQTD
jgi:hypothetical protein